MNETSIEWTEMTWNPFSGCNKVSPGCRNCYAETIANRFKGSKAFPNGFAFTIHPDRFDAPCKLKKPSIIFVNSMSDLFHEAAPLDVLRELFRTMAETPRHRYQILTKRAERLAELAPRLNWAPNIWIGVSVESMAYASRLNFLRRVPAAVHFVSAEPLLGPVALDLTGIEWIIVGGESGPKPRPFNLEWAREIRDTAREAGTLYFLKQLGGYPDKRGSLTDFPPDLRIREIPV
jgi:protein gp37